MPSAAWNDNDVSACRALRALAEQAARAGGAVAQHHFGRDIRVQLKKDRSEVSEADLAAQAAIVTLVRAQRPDDAFITEEVLDVTAYAPPLPPPNNQCVCWVIDPIDGTRNFVRRLPHYSCSVGVMYGGQPIAGAIYDPVRDILYSAAAGDVLHVDGQAIAEPLKRRPAGLNPRLVVGMPSLPVGPPAAMAHRWMDCFVGRNFGSTALHLAMVAAGQLDAMLADNAKLWDIAAGAALLASARARLATPSGDPVFPLDVATYRGTDLPILAATAQAFEQALHA